MKHPNKEFYEDWAVEKIGDKERDLEQRWKVANLANLAIRTLKLGEVNSICEIGGAEGTVLHYLGHLLKAKELWNYELSTEFCHEGQTLYSEIHFINAEYEQSPENKFDLILLSDIIEHIDQDEKFLKSVQKGCRFCLLKIPIEECITNQDWYYKLRGRKKPKKWNYGPGHYNGHLRGYTLSSARKSVSKYFNILDEQISDVAYFYPSKKRITLKHWFGTKVTIYLFGGATFLLGQSK